MQYKRADEVCKIFSISRTTLYRYAKDPLFPKPIRPTKRVTLWNIEKVEEYLKARSKKVESAS